MVRRILYDAFDMGRYFWGSHESLASIGNFSYLQMTWNIIFVFWLRGFNIEEEQQLQKTFREEYLNYCRMVRRSL
jgi:protein-S-isoprenylcysteine O-methyltransferase Ste14